MSTTTVDQLVGDYLGRLDRAAYGLPPERRAELLEEISEHIASARAAGAAADEAAVRTMLDRLGEPEEIVAAARAEGSSGAGAWQVPAMVEHRPGTALETAAVVMLTVGSLLPVLGWLVGVVLLWVSRRWRTSEKLLGTLVVPGGPGLWLVGGGLFTGRSCTTSGSIIFDGGPIPAPSLGPLVPPTPFPRGTVPPAPLSQPGQPPDAGVAFQDTCSGFSLTDGWGVALLVLALIAPFVVAALLLRRARARAALEPPELRHVGVGGASPWGGLEIAAVVLIGAGSFVVPFVGPAVGLVLLWCSEQWTRREKVIGAALTLLPMLFLLLLLATSALDVVVFVSLLGAYAFGLFGPVIAAMYLGRALQRRR